MSVESAHADPRQRARMVTAMTLTYILFAILLNSVGTLILQAMLSMNADKDATSVLDAYKDLPIAIVSFCVASLLPRLGYRRAMMLGLSAVAVACAAVPLLDTFWVIKLLLAVTGGAFALVKVSVYSTIGLLTTDRRQHAGLISTVEGWFMVGVLAGPWLFGAFIGLQATPTDPTWLQVYWILAALSVVVVALLATIRLDESAAREASGGQSFGKDFGDMLRLLALPLVIVFLASAFLYVLIEQGINTWLPTFNAELLRLPAATSVRMASLFAGSLALGRLLAGLLLPRLPWHVLLLVCIACIAVLVLATMPLARAGHLEIAGIPLAAWIFPMIGLFMAPIYPTINSVVLSGLPKPSHASMTGLIVVFSALGGTTGSWLTGQAFLHLGGQSAFLLSLFPLGLLLTALLLLNRLSESPRIS